jgi:lipooligosaccharide transport system ATP-binding protein
MLPMSEGAAAIVTARGLFKHYGADTVVNDVDLQVQAGECFGLLGPNGAGKTTTLRMLLGLTRPDRGDLRVLDYSVPRQARQMRAHIGVVPQSDNLDPDFTVRENLQSYGRYFGLPARQIRARLPALLEYANLTTRARARIEALSGGMKRRLTLARALINDPQLLILDEPTTGLDPQARQHIWQRLRQLRQEGRTLILTTHYMEEAERLCNRLAIMDHGRIVTIGAPRELIARHIEPHVLELHGPGLEAWLAGQSRAPWRIEHVGETVLIYTEDESPVIQALQGHDEVSYLHRRANLEDVFLKLTGRELRE